MSDTTADGDGESGEAKGGKGGMMKIAGAGGLLVVIGLAAFYFFMGGSNGATTAQINNAVPVDARPAVFFELPEMTVNLANDGKNQQYLKLRVALELPSEAFKPKIEQVMPRVLDAFQVYLRELRSDDLKGSAGMFRLKDELRKRVNTAVAPNKIDAILFQDMLVQ